MPDIDVQKVITALAVSLTERGVPIAQIGDWFLVTGAGLLVQARGRDATAQRLEDAVTKLRAGPPTIM